MNNLTYGNNMSWNAGINQGVNSNPNSMQAGSFRNVFGILGGLQSLLHMFTSILDLLYFAKAFKSLVMNLVIKILSKLVRLLKYLFTLKWLFDLIAKSNSAYGTIIYSSQYFKYFTAIFKLSLIFGIILCLCLKIWKMNQIKSLENTDKEINDINSKQEDKTETSLLEKSDEEFVNLIQSEERWKLK